MELLGLTFDWRETFRKKKLLDISTVEYRKIRHGFFKLFEHFYHVETSGELFQALKDDFVATLFMNSGTGLLMSFFRGLYFRLFVNYIFPAVIGKSFKIVNKSNVKIGRFFWAKDNVTLFAGGPLVIGRSGCMAERSTIWSGKRGVYIGDNFFLGMGSYVSAIGERVKIGNNAMIADHVSIYTWNHRYAKGKTPFSKMGGVNGEIIIGDNCWLGSGVKVLAGVRLGSNCVVSAGSIVTKSFDGNLLIAGVPARAVKKIT